MIKVHFAGINSRDLAAHTKGQDVLVSYADLRSPGCWATTILVRPTSCTSTAFPTIRYWIKSP